MPPAPLVAGTDLAPAPSSARPRPRRLARVVLQALLGLNLGLGLAELIFRFRDGGAFPLVNVFEPDALRGVRLRPDSETRVGARGARVTTVRVNADGYRGPAWPEPSADEVVVIGDSLSFGLGVAEDEALAARLHDALPGGRAVLDASVPTYGPPEYLFTMEQILPRRRPGTVVLALNLLNDLGEIGRTNTARHTAVDGWAVRVSEATSRVRPSALRALAVQRSHAAYALWRWALTREMAAAPPEPEEGLRALFDFAAARERARSLLAAHTKAVVARAAVLGLDGLGESYRWGWGRPPPSKAERRVFEMVRKHAKDIAATGKRLWDPRWDAHLDDFDREQGATWFGGCGGGARSRTEARENQLAQTAHQGMTRAVQRYAALPDVAPEAREEIEQAFAAREAEHEARRHPPPPPEVPSPPPPLPMERVIVQAQALAVAAHARLVVVAVPIDVAGLGEGEASVADTVAPDLAATAQRAGAVGVDPTYALREVGPAAYLTDGHLSAAGHEAVARAVTVELKARGGGG